MIEALNELRSIVMRAGSRWTETGLPRVAMVRAEACSDQVYEPMLHLVLQGAKSLSIGDRILKFEEASYFVVPVDVPATGGIEPEDPSRPYLAVSLTLDPAAIAAMMAEMGMADTAPPPAGFSVSPATPELIDAWLRMMRLVDRPQEAAMLAPMIEREILFRILMGPQGDKLREIASADSRLSQIRPAIGWIRDNYAEPIRSEALADMTNMSVAAFYRHFKAVTSMAPIQYQKRLRLLKARRMLLFEARDAGSIAYIAYRSTIVVSAIVLAKPSNGYTFTTIAAVEAARRVLAGELRVGFQTPAGLFGGRITGSLTNPSIDCYRLSALHSRSGIRGANAAKSTVSVSPATWDIYANRQDPSFIRPPPTTEDKMTKKSSRVRVLASARDVYNPRHVSTAFGQGRESVVRSCRSRHSARTLPYAVGYESASQFSREYARMFGLPPRRDAARYKMPGSADEQVASDRAGTELSGLKLRVVEAAS